MNGDLIKRYQTCHTAEDIEAMQVLIQQEMVDEQQARKASKGELVTFHDPPSIHFSIANSQSTCNLVTLGE